VDPNYDGLLLDNRFQDLEEEEEKEKKKRVVYI